ncbi:MAG: FHA domain-containing protein, partial [Propionibacteriaceae bacterium]|nr:FHA domain-containing protein [Propionibacteriaceae bacterium]
MKLKLTVQRGAERHDLLVSADGTATVGDIAAALHAADPNEPRDLAPSSTVTLHVVGVQAGETRTLASDAALIDSGLRSGAHVQVVQAVGGAGAPSGDERGALLRVLSGPDAGRQVDLPAGTLWIGRAEDNAVVLTDPLVSKRHAKIVIGDTVEIVDNNSANGVIVGDRQVGRIRIGSDDVVTLGDTELSVVRLTTGLSTAVTSTDIAFTRPPNVVSRPRRREIDLPEAPSAPNRQKFPWLALAAPLVMGAVMFFTMAEQMRAMSLLFVALSPILMVGAYIDQRLRARRQLRADVKAFQADLAFVRGQLDAVWEGDRDVLLRLYPSVEETCASAAALGRLLWCRRPEHPEFLQVRLGLGGIPPYAKLKRQQSKVGLLEHESQLDDLERDFAQLADAPVVVNLRDCGSLGLAGPRAVLDPLSRSIVAQLICLHSPADMMLACMTSRRRLEQWQWLKWLPHTSAPQSPLGPLHLASDPATAVALLSHLEELVDQRAGRSAEPKPRGPVDDAEEAAEPVLPSVVVLVDDATVDQARLTRVAERGPDVGVHIVWCAEEARRLPAACRTFMELDGVTAEIGQVRQGRVITPVRVETISAAEAERLGRILAPVLDAGAPIQDVSDLPKSVTMVSLVGQEVADQPTAVVARWRENQSIIDRRPGVPPTPPRNPVTLRAVVGHAGADIFTLDLRTQGPHALVGGTTGAGKSEFLQAWVLGMAAAHSPDRVSFLFVDYKGGSAFSRCLDLPHTVGLVTDLSPYLVRRALTSLRAELRFREHLLQEKAAKDLPELEKRGDPDCPPSLIIVVDEFAALVGEVPEFVDGVVDVAQRGRSLGLHLILATQRPAGVIKDNLRANTNLRVALRMADEHDSTDVLGEKTAAYFDSATPGRGAAKTGPGRVAQFQSAYPGAKTPAQVLAAPVEIVEMNFGLGRPWRVPKPRTNLDDLSQDIDRLVASISAAAALAAVPKPRKPWLDSLAPAYDLAKLGQRRDTEIVLGVIDDPENQAQHVECFRPDAEGNIAYYGAGGSGK